MLLTLLSLPDGWNLSVAGLQKILPDGKDKISHALNKLIDYGYVTREQERGGNGKFGTNILEVHEEPVRDEDNPFSDGDSISKPLAEKPSAGNLQQYSNKYISNQEESNKGSSNKKCVVASRAEEANPSDTLSENDYQSLVNDFGKELVFLIFVVVPAVGVILLGLKYYESVGDYVTVAFHLILLALIVWLADFCGFIGCTRLTMWFWINVVYILVRFIVHMKINY